ncbi:MAG: Acg family FMN-binding oxidoreductase [Candidatus Eiseniibacteriota bacterium]
MPHSPWFFTLPLDRRRFLIVVAGAAAHAALRPYAGLARKAAMGAPPLQPWSLPDRAPATEIEIARSLVGAAVLAPSHWNTQPWRFEIEGASIRLLGDPERALPVTDPERRAMRLSLGAALENLLVAARAWGLRPTVGYRPLADATDAVAEVTWTGGKVQRDRGLFHAIVERRTNRHEYDGRGLFRENRAALSIQVSHDFRLHWIDDRERIQAIGQLTHDAVHEQVLDRAAQAERFAWTRFDDGARLRGDGISVGALALGGPAKWLAGRYLNPRSWFLGQGAGSLGKQARKCVRSAGALVLLTAPQRREESWLVGGQVYERFALKATQLGIAHQPISAPIEQERFRPDLLAHFGAAGEDPLMFVRLGHADQPRGSERRAVALVTSFRKA